MPVFRERTSRTDFFNAWGENETEIQFSRALGNSAIAVPATGVGDEAGDGIGQAPGNPTITVGAAATIGSLQAIGDQDYYAVHLDAGVLYQIGLYGHTGGPSGVPLPDAYIELYDANGIKIDVADGGGETPGGQLYGLDAMLTVEVQTSGTYYINARAFDQNDANGETGDGVGDYELFARVSTYDPYYSTFSPLYSIDWGTQVNKVHQSVRNPDGDEGPRDTGNVQGTLNYSDLTSLQALAAAQGKDITGKNVITIYFAHAGEVYVDDDPSTAGTTETIVAKGFEAWELAAYKYALAAYEKVADIVYLIVDSGYSALTQDNPTVDFTFVTYNGTPGPGVSLLGRMSPPDTDNEGQSEFNAADERWTQDGLAPGGFSFTTLIHEMGHGHGLAHPHDNGGHSGVMHGVEAEGVAFDYTNGDYDLNQSVYTMMSYEDGWQKSPYGQADTTDPFGWLKGLMAFDIAAIQDKYGVNEDTATGNDVYILEDSNHGTTFDASNNITQFASGFESIWDAGGTDEIRYVGTRDANIDLRPATLKYEYGGGGWISYAYGIYGGFTIANGVTIENATTGSGNDNLIGNIANNVLDGGAGNDIFDLSVGGDDHAIGGDGNDGFSFGAAFTAADFVEGGAGSNDQIGLQGNYAGGNALTLGAGTMSGVEAIVVLPGFSYDLTMNDGNVAAGGLLKVQATQLLAGQSLHFDGSAEHDGSFMTFGGQGDDSFTGGWGNDGFYFGPGGYSSADIVNGNLGNNDQLGLDGDYGSVGSPLVLGNNVTNVEVVVLMAGPVGTPNHFNVSTNDNLVGAGQTMTIFGLQTSTGFTFDGSNEHDGAFKVYGGTGADVITGSTGADWIFGGDGADTLYGGAGNDVFYYDALTQSNPAGRDGIQDFATGDKMDLSALDAITGGGDDAFTFIGSGAFTNHAGELRAVSSGPIWTVSGDVNGDGVADFELVVVVSDAHPLTGADFTL